MTNDMTSLQQGNTPSTPMGLPPMPGVQWVRVYDSPMPAVVSDAMGVRDSVWPMLTKAGRAKVDAACALINVYDNVLSPQVLPICWQLAYFVNGLLLVEYQRQHILPDCITPDMMWDVESIDVNRLGRMRMSLRPDWLHTTGEFQHIIDQALPRTDRRYGLWFDTSSTDLDPSRVSLISEQGVADVMAVRSYLGAKTRFEMA